MCVFYIYPLQQSKGDYSDNNCFTVSYLHLYGSVCIAIYMNLVLYLSIGLVLYSMFKGGTFTGKSVLQCTCFKKSDLVFFLSLCLEFLLEIYNIFSKHW